MVPTDIGRALLDARTGTLIESVTHAYRPSKAVTDFVTTRDGTCRMWGCTRPATSMRPRPRQTLARRANQPHQPRRALPTPPPPQTTTPLDLPPRPRRHRHLDLTHRHQPHHPTRLRRPTPTTTPTAEPDHETPPSTRGHRASPVLVGWRERPITACSRSSTARGEAESRRRRAWQSPRTGGAGTLQQQAVACGPAKGRHGSGRGTPLRVPSSTEERRSRTRAPHYDRRFSAPASPCRLRRPVAGYDEVTVWSCGRAPRGRPTSCRASAEARAQAGGSDLSRRAGSRRTTR